MISSQVTYRCAESALTYSHLSLLFSFDKTSCLVSKFPGVLLSIGKSVYSLSWVHLAAMMLASSYHFSRGTPSLCSLVLSVSVNSRLSLCSMSGPQRLSSYAMIRISLVPYAPKIFFP